MFGLHGDTRLHDLVAFVVATIPIALTFLILLASLFESRRLRPCIVQRRARGRCTSLLTIGIIVAYGGQRSSVAKAAAGSPDGGSNEFL